MEPSTAGTVDAAEQSAEEPALDSPAQRALDPPAQLQKYVIKNVARQAGKTATFMPKPLFEENGLGMHVHPPARR